MWWIIAIVLVLITVCMLKDTHVKVYDSYCYRNRLQDEYDFKLPVWALLLIVPVYIVPVMNIIAFIAFLIYYIVHAVWDSDTCRYETHVFSLNGNNWVTKTLLAIKEVLNKKI